LKHQDDFPNAACGTKQQLYKKQHISFHFLVGGRLVARKT
jgi:hypothetical protein